MRRLAAAVAIIAVLALAAVAHAQAPTPTAEPELSMFPYRIVITGPASIPEGQPGIFDVRYQRISSAAGSNNQIVLVHEGADFGSIAARQGEAPDDLGPQNADAERIALLSDAGEFDVTLRPHAGFAGALTLTFYVPGTGIALPDGTVDHATTEIVGAGDVVVTVFNDLNTNGVRDDGRARGRGMADRRRLRRRAARIHHGRERPDRCRHGRRDALLAPGASVRLAPYPRRRQPRGHARRAARRRGLLRRSRLRSRRDGAARRDDLPRPAARATRSRHRRAVCSVRALVCRVRAPKPRGGRRHRRVFGHAGRLPERRSGDRALLGGPGPAGPQLTFAPGTTALGTWVDGGDSMRFYASDVTDAWVLDVASGRLTKGCAVTMPLHGGLQPPGFARVFVLSDEVRAGCGAPGRMVRLVRGDQLLDPILNWQAGDLAQPPQLTIAVLSVTPPNAGDGASAARAGRTPLAVALGALALACAALSGGLLPRRRSR